MRVKFRRRSVSTARSHQTRASQALFFANSPVCQGKNFSALKIILKNTVRCDKSNGRTRQIN
uniref:Uncharacterized protein n=1 Tax=Anguilla anguilla TaxID=7936 RepID=A0A0E9RS72_ANGAN